MSTLDDILNIGPDDDLVTEMFDLIPDAKFELAALHAQAAEAETLRATAAEQARQLDVVRDGIAALISYRNKNLLNFQLEKADDYINALRLWLAENAPAQTEAEDTK